LITITQFLERHPQPEWTGPFAPKQLGRWLRIWRDDGVLDGIATQLDGAHPRWVILDEKALMRLVKSREKTRGRKAAE